jgi:hypothetical protein
MSLIMFRHPLALDLCKIVLRSLPWKASSTIYRGHSMAKELGHSVIPLITEASRDK